MNKPKIFFFFLILSLITIIGITYRINNPCKVSRNIAINNFINQQIDEMVNDKDNYFDSNIYISKYDLSDKELVKQLIIQSDGNKSFEENFGVVAKISFNQIKNINKCLSLFSKHSKCLNITDSSSRIFLDEKSIKLNKSTMNYYIDNNYTYMFDSGRKSNSIAIYPMRLLDVKGNQFVFPIQGVYKSCCDKNMILTDIERGLSGGRGAGRFYQKFSPTPASDIPKISLENSQYQPYQLDELYKNVVLEKPKDVEKFWKLKAISLIEYSKYPNLFEREINTFTCEINENPNLEETKHE